MPCAARLATRYAPVRFASTTFAKDSSDMRSSSVSSVVPALETSTWTGPSSASTTLNAASTCSPEVTSHSTPNSPSGAPLPRWVTATRSPFAAKARAIASPIPRLPPVTSTVRPSTIPTLADRGEVPRAAALPVRRVGAARAIQITEFGGPETLVVRQVPDPQPAEGQQVLDVLAAGINYADTHQTEDSYLAKQTLPMI